MIKPIATLDFKKAPDIYFDVASIGVTSCTANEFAVQLGPDPTGELDRADPLVPRRCTASWDNAVDSVRRSYGELLGVHKRNVSIFHNTTAAIQRVLIRLGRIPDASTATLLITDVEYPGVFAALEELWPGPVVVLRISDYLWASEAPDTQEIVDVFAKAIRLIRPTVLYFSHVARTSGYVLPAAKIVEQVRAINPPTFIFVDGAQAIGNIFVPPSLLNEVDAYVTSGHKWLCGKTTLGLLYAPQEDEWSFDDPAQSYSLQTNSSGSGILDVLLSIQKSLEDFVVPTPHTRMLQIQEHNAALASLFEKELDPRLFRIQPVGQRTGIVAFRPVGYLPDSIGDYRFSTMKSENLPIFGKDRLLIEPCVEGRNGERETFLGWRRLDRSIQTETKASNIRRVCFHYFHGENDALTFAKALNEAAHQYSRT